MTDTVQSAEDAARRLARELNRLQEGMLEMGIALREGPVEGAEVDTALEWLKSLKESYEAWLERAESLDRIVSPIVRVLRAEGY